MAKLVSYRDLRVWQDGMELAEIVYRLSRRLPASEMYALVDQLKRASVSVPANIAEGFGRGHLNAYINHLLIARGSLFEVDTLVRLAARVRLVGPPDTVEAFEVVERTGRRLTRLVAALRRAGPHRRTPKAQGPGPKADRGRSDARIPHQCPPAPP